MPDSAEGVPGGRSLMRFSRVERTRTHVYIAEQLRRQITLGVLPTGGTLPPARALAAMFGVARATVQRAVRILESEGLVTPRRGRGGGTFLTRPPSDDASKRYLISLVRPHPPLIEEPTGYRFAVQPAAAGEAPRARTENHLPVLPRI